MQSLLHQNNERFDSQKNSVKPLTVKTGTHSARVSISGFQGLINPSIHRHSMVLVKCSALWVSGSEPTGQGCRRHYVSIRLGYAC